MMTSNAFTKAEVAAQAQSDQQKLGTAAASCPLMEKEEKYRIEVLVVGEDDEPLGDIAVVLRRASGEELKKVTDDAGHCAFEGLDQAQYELSLVELDADCWTEIKREVLLGDAGKSLEAASWPLPVVIEESKEIVHIIKQGECVSKLAEHYGFIPNTIWHYPKNAELRKKRHDDLYILNPEDEVVIPAKRIKNISITENCKTTLRRIGVPERLRIRFLRYDESPRAGTQYLLSVKSRNGAMIPTINGKTDQGGFVDQCLPPSASHVQIILQQEQHLECCEFNIGYVDPIDTFSGIHSRLNNLGFNYDEDCDESNAIIKSFQASNGLTPTGTPDSSLLLILQKKFGS